METRMKWGNVIWAAIFAVAVIGTAIGTYFFESDAVPFLSRVATERPNDVDGDGLSTWEEKVWRTDPQKADTDGDGASDGAEVRAGTSPTIAGAPTNPYEASGGVTPTQSVAQNLANVQLTIGLDATDEEWIAASNVVAESVKLPDLEEKIVYADMRVSETTSLPLYTEVLYEMLRESTAVREYEMSLFRRTVIQKNFYGTPELKTAAIKYREIEAGLLAMPVPPSVANEHLAVINAIGTLANVIDAMANWGGDPFAGLAYTHTFTATESRVQTSLANLFEKIASLLKK